MDAMLYDEQLTRMRRYFESNATRSYAFRKQQLTALKKSILAHEQEIYAALHQDLKKSPEECWVTELGIVINEINHALKNLRRWMEPERVPTNLVNLPSSSRIIAEPLGVVLIIGPWNYPFQLLFNPLVGAIAAGNCTVLKPSEYAAATEAVMQKIIGETFDKEYIFYAAGDGAQVVPALMDHFTFDHVFFTGGTTVGKIIYKKAAERLVPVTLELGGKSPCIIEPDASLEVAARRIAVTKFTNAGQTCTAPDYILVHESVRTEFVTALKKYTVRFFSERPEESYNYGKLINEKQFDRLSNYLSQGMVLHGGRTDRSQLFIEPTLLGDVKLHSGVMQEEIFGPLLPILSFNTMEEAKTVIAQNPNPLAFYVFTSSKKKEKEWMETTAFGGGCVNNASWHFTNHHLPFGGRGFSGMGKCHGHYSFQTFSHQKSVLKTPAWFDPSMKYPPFKGKLKLFKWLFR